MAKIAKQFKARPEQRVINANLDWILANTRIEIENPDNPDAPLVLQGRELLMEALRVYAHKSPTIGHFLEAESLLSNPMNRDKFPQLRGADGEWRMPTADEICGFLDIESEGFLNEVDAALRYFGVRKAELLVRIALPEVVQAAVASAKSDGKNSAADRKLVMEAAKLIETKPMVTVDQRKLTVNNNYPGERNGVPAWPSTAVAVSAAVKALPAATESSVVEAELVEAEECTIHN